MRLSLAITGDLIADSYRNAEKFSIYDISEDNAITHILALEAGSDADTIAKALSKMSVAALVVGSMDKASRLPYMMRSIAILAGQSGTAGEALALIASSSGCGCDSGSCEGCASEEECTHSHSS